MDVSAVKQAIDLAAKNRHRRRDQCSRGTISDPLARKLVEWVILRSDSGATDFSRYVNFIAANPSWPSISLLRRRAEGVAWEERVDPQAVIQFFRSDPPHTVKKAISRWRGRADGSGRRRRRSGDALRRDVA